MHLQTPMRWASSRLLASLGSLTAVLLLAFPVPAHTRSITGTVVDKFGRQPLNGVQVNVEGTQRGGLTDARGRFNISGVPAGQVTLRAVYIGYRTERQQVTVASGEGATANFELGVSAVSLDEVV